MLDKTQSEISEIDAAAEQAVREAAARADEMICRTETRSGKLLTVLDVGSQVEIEDAAGGKIRGTISCVCIRAEGTTYEVWWLNNGSLSEHWFPEAALHGLEFRNVQRMGFSSEATK